jgi:hypothetical protein
MSTAKMPTEKMPTEKIPTDKMPTADRWNVNLYVLCPNRTYYILCYHLTNNPCGHLSTAAGMPGGVKQNQHCHYQVDILTVDILTVTILTVDILTSNI